MEEDVDSDQPQRIYGVYTHAKPDGTVFYVGKGDIRRSKRFEVGRNIWHRNIVQKYGRENIQIVFIPCNSEKLAFAEERRLIAEYRRLGIKLANLTNGGEGSSGYRFSEGDKARRAAKIRGQRRTPEQCAKIGNALRGKRRTEEQCARISAAKTGQGHTAASRAKIGAASRRRRHSAATRLKMSASQMGKTPSADVRAKISAKLKGRKRSAEAIAKTVAKLKGRKLSPEHCRAIAEGNRGGKRSEATKRRMSAAQKGHAGHQPAPESLAKRSASLRKSWENPERRLRASERGQGRKLSSEIKEKISKSHLGKKATPEARAKISSALKGRIISSEWRAKIGAGRLLADEGRGAVWAILVGFILAMADSGAQQNT